MDEENISEIEESYELESVMAEVKSEAFINGDKRTPKDVLDEQTRRIVEEVRGMFPDEFGVTENKPAEPETHAAATREAPVEKTREASEKPAEQRPRSSSSVKSETKRFEPRSKKRESEDEAEYELGDVIARIDAQESGKTPEIETEAVNDSELKFFDNFEYSGYTPDEEIQRAVAAAIERETQEEEDETPTFLDRTLSAMSRKRGASGRASSRASERVHHHEEEQEEPDYRERAKVFAKRCNSLSPRALASGVVAVIMIFFTLSFESGRSLPFGIGRSVMTACGVMLIMQLIVMLLSSDLLAYGASRLIKGAPSMESLLLVSGIATLLDGFYTILRIRGGLPPFDGLPLMPYSAAFAVASAFALVGERMYLEGIAATLRQAASGVKPQARETRPIVSEYRSDLDRTIIKHTSTLPRGFYANLMQADACEQAYTYLAPVMLVFAAIISAAAALLHPEVQGLFPRMLAGVLCGTTAFQGAISFAAPFISAVKRAKRRGVSLAGSGGADALYYTDGVCVTDDDIFPPGTISIGKARILDDVPPDKALAYTASLIVASGGGLGRVFSEFLTRRNLSLLQTQEFTYYEDGVSGFIQGDQVMTGSSALMKLNRIRLPEGFEQTNAVYTAVNGRLIAMFPVDYMPMAAVQRAISAILRRGIQCYLSVRDFNITPKSLSRSFSVNEDDLLVLPTVDAYASEAHEADTRTAALMTRGGIDIYSETVAMGRRLKLVSLVLTAVTIAASVVGALMTAVLLWSGEWELARAGRILLFLSMSAAISIIAALLGTMFRNADF